MLTSSSNAAPKGTAASSAASTARATVGPSFLKPIGSNAPHAVPPSSSSAGPQSARKRPATVAGGESTKRVGGATRLPSPFAPLRGTPAASTAGNEGPTPTTILSRAPPPPPNETPLFQQRSSQQRPFSQQLPTRSAAVTDTIKQQKQQGLPLLRPIVPLGFSSSPSVAVPTPPSYPKQGSAAAPPNARARRRSSAAAAASADDHHHENNHQQPLPPSSATAAAAAPLSVTSPQSAAAAAAALLLQYHTANPTAFVAMGGGKGPQPSRRAWGADEEEGDDASTPRAAAIMTQQQLYAKQRGDRIQSNVTKAMGDLIHSMNDTYYHRRTAAAITIQCAWRSTVARIEAFGRRQVFLHYVFVQQKAAVTCLVSFFKGILLRKRRLIIKERHAAALVVRTETQRRQRSAALTIINAFRRYFARRRETQRLMRLLRLRQEEKLTHYRTAAVILQRWFRIVRVEKAYWRRRNEEVRIEKARQREADRVDGAATTIQRRYRGVLGRRYAIDYKEDLKRQRVAHLRRIKESIDVVRVFLRSYAAKVRREKESGQRLIVSPDGSAVTAVPLTTSTSGEVGAAVVVGEGGGTLSLAVSTRTLASRLLEDRDERLRAESDYLMTQKMVREAQRIVYQRAMETAKSCTVIQRTWRRWKARRELKIRRTIAVTHNRIRVDKEYDQFKAVLLTQRLAMAAVSARLSHRIHTCNDERFWASLRLVQRTGRGFACRQQQRQQQCLSIYLANKVIFDAEKAYRKNLGVVEAFVAYRDSALKRLRLAESKRAADEQLLLEVRRQVTEDKAAATIQRLVRSHANRQATRAEVMEMHKSQNRILSAIVKIQSFIRSKVIAKNRYNKLKARATFDRRNNALETEMREKVLLDFLSRFEALEAEGRKQLADKERTRRSKICMGFGVSEIKPAGGSGSSCSAETDSDNGERDSCEHPDSDNLYDF